MDDGSKLSIFHPTDFSWTSKVAFAHALKLAVICGNKFTILHTGSREEPSKDWDLFPRVRATLENWGLLKSGSSEDAVYDKLGIEVEKIDGGDFAASNGACQLSSGFEMDSVDVLGRFNKVLPATKESTDENGDCT